MKKIIFATGNADKMKEIRKILADLDAEVVSMKEAGIQADIVEDGKTFEENAVIKATAISKLTSDGEIVLADDSGLEIDQVLRKVHGSRRLQCSSSVLAYGFRKYHRGNDKAGYQGMLQLHGSMRWKQPGLHLHQSLICPWFRQL